MGQSQPLKSKILVVDDDRDVLAVTAALLEADGYEVLCAASPSEALLLLKADRDVVLLFTDIVLPGSMNGFDLAEKAKAIRPGLRVLYTSGFLQDEGAWEGQLLTKPWTEGDLKRAMTELWPAA